ncbi:collagen-like protein [Streptomyces rimosus]|uniref:hypothetical protein n=1 Tax=Streptomyces rimosus TaxID=1927 RepID=UPI0004C6B71A|nr:hypothetical protein [Streptomyces rimosus]
MSTQRKATGLPRAEWLAMVTLLLFLGGMAWLAVQVVDLHGELQTANGARDALARQVQALGGKPVAGPPGSRGDSGRTVRGPAGPRGATGPAGSEGSPGPAGQSGAKGPTGAAGAAGKDGASGSDGATGADGAAGKDGTAGQPGPQGPQGEPGPAGPAGKDGAPGRDGQTCPVGYSLQAPPGDPDALVCRRDGAPAPQPTQTSTPPALAPARKRK